MKGEGPERPDIVVMMSKLKRVTASATVRHNSGKEARDDDDGLTLTH